MCDLVTYNVWRKTPTLRLRHVLFWDHVSVRSFLLLCTPHFQSEICPSVHHVPIIYWRMMPHKAQRRLCIASRYGADIATIIVRTLLVNAPLIVPDANQLLIRIIYVNTIARGGKGADRAPAQRLIKYNSRVFVHVNVRGHWQNIMNKFESLFDIMLCKFGCRMMWCDVFLIPHNCEYALETICVYTLETSENSNRHPLFTRLKLARI